MRWLSELPRKMKEVPAKYLILDGTINPGERVIGRLPDDLLRLWGLHLQMAEEISDSLQRHMLSHMQNRGTEKECLSFHTTIEWAVRQYEAVARLFWVAVRSEFDVLDGSLGVRAHGDVVTYDEPSDQELDEETMRAMLEQMQCGGKPN